MGHQALYRKYRPKTFDDVCGQDHITSVLKYESMENKISHAYLFCGPRGTGKTTCAKILAKSINCESPVDGNPCGKCFACTSIDNETATDVLEMDAASNTGVDYIREIRDEVTYTPAALKKRVYIIDEVHMLSIGAFNALLKTLEEPPEHVVFILATTEQHKLPPTVISRCQRFDFRRIPVDVISQRLEKIANDEKISLDNDAAQLVAKQAQGGLRDAINLFELCVGGKDRVDAARVKEALGISGIESAYKIASAVKSKDYDALFAVIDNVISSSKDIFVFWQELISFWRDMIVLKYTSSESEYLDLTDNEKELLRDASDKFTTSELMYHCNLLDNAVQTMNRIPQIKRLTAEITLMKMCDAKLDLSPQAMNSRLTSLENELLLMKKGGSVQQPDVIAYDQENKNISTEKQAKQEPITESAGNPESEKNGNIKLSSSDLSEFISKVGEINPMIKGFLNKTECFLSPDYKQAVIIVKNNFAIQMLSSDENKNVLSDALLLSGICDSKPSVNIQLQDKDDDSRLNDFEDFI